MQHFWRQRDLDQRNLGLWALCDKAASLIHQHPLPIPLKSCFPRNLKWLRFPDRTLQKDSSYIQGQQTNKPRYWNPESTRHLRKEALGFFIPLPKGLDFVVTQEYLQLGRQNPALHSNQGSQINGKKEKKKRDRERRRRSSSSSSRKPLLAMNAWDTEMPAQDFTG